MRDRTLFFRYAVKNVVLPQTADHAIAMGQTVTGAMRVEAVFGYPGLGSTLNNAIRYGCWTAFSCRESYSS